MAGSQGQTGTSSQNSGMDNGQQSSQQSGGMQNGSQNGSTGTSGSQAGGFETAGSGSESGGGFDTQGGNGNEGDDPFADLSAGNGQVMTAAERRAALDARLNEGFAEFDGMILGERERVQADADEAGSGVMSGTGGGGGGDRDGSGNAGNGPLIIASAPQGSTGGGIMPAGNVSREGEFSNTQQETFPIPDDIPPGANDDVVARQLREAAMNEPDPELREKLWDEYRAYTGIGQ